MKIQQIMEAGVARYHSAQDVDEFDNDALEQLEIMLETKCSNAMEAYRESPKSVLLRGIRGTRNDVFIQDTRSSTRSAENTDNYVTLFSEVLTSWNDIPPRSKIISATTNRVMAEDYADGSSNNVFVVVPTNESILTYSGHADFWGSLPNLEKTLGAAQGVSAFNMYLRQLIKASGSNIPTSAPDLIQWCGKFDEIAKNNFTDPTGKNRLWAVYQQAKQPMLELVNYLLNPANAVVSRNGRILTDMHTQEVGIYGEAVYVRSSLWDLLA